MKKSLGFGILTILLFAVSASVSWFLQGPKIPSGDLTPTRKTSPPKITERPSRPQTTPEAQAQPPGEPPPRSVARPPYTPGTDDAVQLAASLRERLAAVREKEDKLAAQQKNLELVYQDIRGERGAIDELRKQVTEELKAVQGKMSDVERERAKAEEKRQETDQKVSEMQKNLFELEGVERDNIRKMAETFDSMAPESAAKILQSLADTARMDTAVKVLGQMKERQAAKVLAELSTTTPDGAALAAQLLEKLKGFKRPSSGTKKAAGAG